MPKTNYYSFGLSASRDAYKKVYNPHDQNSPRGRDMSDQPGPGEYKYKNLNIGVGARKFSFLSRTKNPQGKCNESRSVIFAYETLPVYKLAFLTSMFFEPL